MNILTAQNPVGTQNTITERNGDLQRAEREEKGRCCRELSPSRSVGETKALDANDGVDREERIGGKRAATAAAAAIAQSSGFAV